jgi:hypothetical protein
MTKENPDKDLDTSPLGNDGADSSMERIFSEAEIQAAINLSMQRYGNVSYNYTNDTLKRGAQADKGKNRAKETFPPPLSYQEYYNPDIHGSSSSFVGNSSTQTDFKLDSDQVDSDQEADLHLFEDSGSEPVEDNNEIIFTQEGDKIILTKDEKTIVLTEDERELFAYGLITHEEIWENRIAQENLLTSSRNHFSTSSSPFSLSSDQPMAKFGPVTNKNYTLQDSFGENSKGDFNAVSCQIQSMNSEVPALSQGYESDTPPDLVGSDNEEDKTIETSPTDFPAIDDIERLGRRTTKKDGVGR